MQSSFEPNATGTLIGCYRHLAEMQPAFGQQQGGCGMMWLKDDQTFGARSGNMWQMLIVVSFFLLTFAVALGQKPKRGAL